MSRAAALADRKGGQKAAIAEKKAQHATDLAMGLNATMQKFIRDDELLCTVCSATKKGPITACQCPGGRSKPGPDYCPKAQLVEAAKARGALEKEKQKKENLKSQGAIQGARIKKREGGVDLDAEFQGDGVDLTVVVKMPIGKLGMSLEKNCVSAVTGEPSLELGIKRDKAAISKAIMEVFKEQKMGVVEFRFRTPITEGFLHCTACDKFLDENDFDPKQVEAGPGKQMCSGCEEFSGMFG